MNREHKENQQEHKQSNTFELRTAIKERLSSIQQIKHPENIQDGPSASLEIGLGLVELSLLENIKVYRNIQNPGYFCYDNWKKMHFALWGNRVDKACECLWKILRLINLGSVKIPTGLVFQILKAAVITKSRKQMSEVLQHFLRNNNIRHSLASFRDLKNYPSFEEIITQYQDDKDDILKTESCLSEKTLNNQTNIFHRCSSMKKKQQQKLSNLRYNSLVEEIKECSFTPELTKYTSKKSLIYSKVHPCSQKKQKQQQNNCIFLATPVDFKIYNKTVSDIPGAKAHILKQQSCQGQRLRLKRFFSKPVGAFR